MDLRKIKILQAIIDDYINSGEPVGSRTIAKKYDLGISSATIRNEMSDLEEMGYLEQLHTSSGRIPSDKGYRIYVDRLMQLQKLSPEEENVIKSKLIDAALFEVDKVLKNATQLLSDLTKLICVVKTPSSSLSHVKAIQLMNIDKNSLLLVIVLENGMINNNLIRVSVEISPESLLRLNNILNKNLKGLTIEEINLKVINNLKLELKPYDDIFDAIISNLYDCLNTASNSDVYMEGATNILNYPEYKDVDKAKNILDFVENDDNLKKILTSDNNVSILIGKENNIIQAKDCSIITAVYGFGKKPLGTIGIIGPTRMPYSKILPILNLLVNELNESINQNYFDDR